MMGTQGVLSLVKTFKRARLNSSALRIARKMKMANRYIAANMSSNGLAHRHSANLKNDWGNALAIIGVFSMTNDSLVEKIERDIWHVAQDTDFDAGFNLAKQMAIAIVRQHQPEGGCQYPYVKIGKYIVAAYPEYIWIGLDGDGEGGGFDEAKLEAVINKFYGENF
jgi:hypothetical protein